MNYRAYYLAREFVKKGHEVRIFSASYSHLFKELPQTTGTFTKEMIDGIEYIWVKTPKYKSSKSIMRVISMLVFMFRLLFFKSSNKIKPDEIIISSLSLFPILNAYLWSKKFKIKFIFEVRDIWPLTLIEVGGFSKWHPLVIILAWFEKFGYKKAKYVVSVLPHAHLHMKKKGMKADKFRYIPNGISVEEVSNYENISKEIQDQIPKDKFIVGYVGTLGIANALEYLLDTAELLKENTNIHFVLVGKGGEEETLKAKVKEQKLQNITFIPSIPKIQVQSILQKFDICYLGWYNKGIYQYGVSPNKVFDYMYSGKSILHSISVNNDIISKAKCGITVESENPIAIKEIIIEFFLKDLGEMDRMGANGKAYVLKYHSYASLAQSYIQLMENNKE
jgi:glycosyltransferase involved in cell wall biosynthesis